MEKTFAAVTRGSLSCTGNSVYNVRHVFLIFFFFHGQGITADANAANSCFGK